MPGTVVHQLALINGVEDESHSRLTRVAANASSSSALNFFLFGILNACADLLGLSHNLTPKGLTFVADRCGVRPISLVSRQVGRLVYGMVRHRPVSLN